jgi:hypothetical protein
VTSCHGNWPDPGTQLGFHFNLDASDVELGLQVEPELGTGAEEDAKGQGGFRIDGALALNDFIDGGAGDASAVGEFRLGQLEAVEG